MYTFMYVYECLWTYAYTSVQSYIHIYVCMYVYIYIYISYAISFCLLYIMLCMYAIIDQQKEALECISIVLLELAKCNEAFSDGSDGVPDVRRTKTVEKHVASLIYIENCSEMDHMYKTPHL
jgi:hypothetical protein